MTCKDWSHIWLNEGFASYFDPLFAEHDRGDDVFRLEMNGSLAAYLGSDRRLSPPDRRAALRVGRRHVRQRDLFERRLRAAHAARRARATTPGGKASAATWPTHKLKTVESDDFRKAMEAASGKDLKWFFDQWVYKAGHPELKVRWHYEDADKTVRVQVKQTQKIDEQTPLFRLPTTLEITEGTGRTRVVPIVIDRGHARVRDPGGRASRRWCSDRSAGLADQGARLREVDRGKPVSSSSTPQCVLGRLDAARALAKVAKDQPDVAKALALRPGNARSRRSPAHEDVRGPVQRRRDVPRRADRGRQGLRGPRSRRGDRRPGRGSSATQRPRPSSARPGPTPRKPTVRARPRSRPGRAGRSSDADELLAQALKVTADHHSIAATALELMLETSGAKSRELAALYSKYGQPEPLRSAAIGAFSRLAKDDPTAPGRAGRAGRRSRSLVRIRAWTALRELGVKKADTRPAKPGSTRESVGFSGYTSAHARRRHQRPQGTRARGAKGNRAGSGQRSPGTRHRRARAPGRRARAQDQGAAQPHHRAQDQRRAPGQTPAAGNTAAGAASSATTGTAH